MKLVFLGPPGAGKGTMAVRLSRDTNIPHISTGEIIRAAIRNQTELGKQVKEIVESGGLVPDDMTIALVDERLQEADVAAGYILDGFPRTTAQADALAAMNPPGKVINFALSDEEIIARLSGRRVHKASGRTYHIIFNPPKVSGKDDVTGEDLIIRQDDTPEAISKRLEVYRSQTAPLISYYRERNLLIELDSSPEPESVYAALKTLLL